MRITKLAQQDERLIKNKEEEQRNKYITTVRKKILMQFKEDNLKKEKKNYLKYCLFIAFLFMNYSLIHEPTHLLCAFWRKKKNPELQYFASATFL